MSDAVISIGIPRLKVLMTIELLTATMIIFLLCILKKNIIYLCAFGGILCGYVYSAPPLRIKKRGVLSPAPVIFGLYFLPLVAGWFVVTDRVSLFIILFGIGYAFIMQGITFINTCEDFKEDRISGVRTFAHVIGIRKTLLLASLFVVLGGFIDLGLLIFVKMNLKNISILPLMAILFLCLFFFLAIILISKNLYLVNISKDPFSLSKTYAAQMPKWFLATRYPLLLLSLLLIP
jgi:1,4-dihydroxy-2-naphthoate octaprenyltransferase